MKSMNVKYPQIIVVLEKANSEYLERALEFAEFGKERNIFIVGDEKQHRKIYSFRKETHTPVLEKFMYALENPEETGMLPNKKI